MTDGRDAVRAGENVGLKPSLSLAGGTLSRRKQALSRPCYSGLLQARSGLQIEINSYQPRLSQGGARAYSDTDAVVVFRGVH